MKYFLEMIIQAKHQPAIQRISHDADKGQTIYKNHFFDMAKKAKVFVFSAINKEPEELPEIFDDEGNIMAEKLDAPFSVFTIEMDSGLLTIPRDDDRVKISTYCLLAYEIAPSKFEYYALVDFQGTQMIIQTTLFDTLAKVYIDRINSERQGIERVNKLTVLEGKHKRKYDHIIKDIIHIRPKKSQIPINPGTGKPIEWRYRVIARGHWRTFWLDEARTKIDTTRIGKDREGVYHIAGQTWISESKPKGPAHLPIKDKIRKVT